MNHHILVSSISHNNSLSPNERKNNNTLHSTLKKKKKATVTKQTKKKDSAGEHNLTQSMQLFKPPINKNLSTMLMQSSLNLKGGAFTNLLLNESKDSASHLRFNTTANNLSTFNTTNNNIYTINNKSKHNNK